MPSSDVGQEDSRREGSILTTFLAKALMTGAALVGAGVVGAEGRKLIVPDHQEAQEALRRVLRDPDKTDKLIEAITADSASNELATDPHVVTNLTRLAAAMIEKSREGVATGGARPKKWAKDEDLSPVQRQLLEDLFPHLRLEPPKRSF